MAQPEFSERGDAPTDFERELVEQFGNDEPRHVRQLWLLVAQRIGVDAFAVVLDELGGMANLSVPTRAAFFADLHRAQRNQEIRECRARGDRGIDIARRLHIHPSSVSRALSGFRVTRTHTRGIRPSWSKRKPGSRTR